MAPPNVVVLFNLDCSSVSLANWDVLETMGALYSLGIMTSSSSSFVVTRCILGVFELEVLKWKLLGLFDFFVDNEGRFLFLDFLQNKSTNQILNKFNCKSLPINNDLSVKKYLDDKINNTHSTIYLEKGKD